MHSSANNSTGSSQNRQSKSRKMPKVRGISVNHPHSRRQKALAAEKSRKTSKNRNQAQNGDSKLNSLKTKLASNLANMTQHVNNLNKHSKNTTHLEDLAKDALNEFLELYFKLRDTYGDIRGEELEERIWNELEHSNDNTDTLARKTLKKFSTTLTEILNKHSYALHHNDKLEKLMWKRISK
jgi:hypothetical protein